MNCLVYRIGFLAFRMLVPSIQIPLAFDDSLYHPFRRRMHADRLRNGISLSTFFPILLLNCPVSRKHRK